MKTFTRNQLMGLTTAAVITFVPAAAFAHGKLESAYFGERDHAFRRIVITDSE
ncbi:hypothetical protein [Paraburkholderia fungorum]|jgi:hypothetical protein|uniref:hypothetical protein n=1 Tax=Paraburkholderia fungorum TaxID=134537 RepID=UPI0017CAC036|nr:hypothetical protein [Paraburkholderia fungorum]MBB5545019.1 hypothetical protein [Paraburkholderia fungorum]